MVKPCVPLLVVGGLFAQLTSAQCLGPSILINGDFDSAEGVAVTASGWSPMGSPDVNDENGLLNTTGGYFWTVQPLASMNGGTWQNICCGVEGVSQTAETTEGATYDLCFEYAAQGIYSDSYTYAEPGCIEVSINGSSAFTAPVDTTAFTWASACMSFVATASSTVIQFTTCGSDSVYMAIDGACMKEDLSNGISSAGRVAPTIVPNPVNGSCRITCDRPFDRVEVVDARGSLLFLPAVQGHVDLARLACGVHMVRCWTSSGPVSGPVRMVVSPF